MVVTMPSSAKKRTAICKDHAKVFHDFFISDKDTKYSDELIASIALRITKSEVPGYVSRKKRISVRRFRITKAHKVLTDAARKTLKALLSWILGMHKLGKCLNGNFTYDDLRMTARGSVKCRSYKIKLMKNSNPSRIVADMATIKKIILEIAGVTRARQLPSDLKLLLQVLSQYQPGDEMLIKKHPALRKDSKKMDQFSKMFAHMEVLEKTDNTKYTNIIAKLPYGQGEWKLRIQANKYLMKIFKYGRRMSSYADGPDGLVKLYRNSIQHLPKGHSVLVKIVQRKGKTLKKKVLLFKYYQIYHMLSSTLPKVTGKIAQALHEEGELENALA